MLTQILFIVGLPWVGVAAKQGPSHIVLWLAAIILFYIPSAFVVIYLNRAMPLEGGLYQWAKLGFNDLVGFMVAWNLWLFAILNTSEVGLQITQYLGYIMGPGSEWLTANAWFICGVNTAIIGALIFITVVGLGVGKWVHKAGGVFMILIFAGLMLLPLLNLAHGTITEYHPFRTEMPLLNLLTLNLLGKMGFGALGGFEYVAIHAGEVARSGSHDRPFSGRRGADHRFDVYPGHCVGSLAHPAGPDRSDRPDPAGIERRIWPSRCCCGHRTADHICDDVDPYSRSERDVCRQHTSADGRGVGQPVARLVYKASTQNTGRRSIRSCSSEQQRSQWVSSDSSASASRRPFNCCGMPRASFTHSPIS